MQSSSFFFLGTHYIKLPSLAGRFPQGRATSRTILLSGYSGGIRQFPTYAHLDSNDRLRPIRPKVARRCMDDAGIDERTAKADRQGHRCGPPLPFPAS